MFSEKHFDEFPKTFKCFPESLEKEVFQDVVLISI